MSSFENSYYTYLTGGYKMPAWAKAERYEYCDHSSVKSLFNKAFKWSSTQSQKTVKL